MEKGQGAIVVYAYGDVMADFFHVPGVMNIHGEKYISGYVKFSVLGVPLIYFGGPDDDFFMRVKR